MLAGGISIRHGFLSLCAMALAGTAFAQSDPGPRGGTVGAGGALSGLSTDEANFFGAARPGSRKWTRCPAVSSGSPAAASVRPSTGIAVLSPSQQQDVLNFLRSL